MQVSERLMVDSMERGAGVSDAQWLCWSLPPPPNLMKVNFDAALWKDGRATVVCVLRGHKCNLLPATGFNCNYLLVEEAELRAAWESIRFMKIHYHGIPCWLTVMHNGFPLELRILAEEDAAGISVTRV